MSSSKRRKLDVPSDSPRLSAFAARKALQSIGSSERAFNKQEDEAQTKSFENDPSSISEDLTMQVKSRDYDGIKTREPPKSKLAINNEKLQLEPDEAGHSSTESRAESPEIQVDRPPTVLSSLRPNKSNIRELAHGALRVKLAPGEVVHWPLPSRKVLTSTAVGNSWPIQVMYRERPVSALASHSLPVIRCLATEVNHAEIGLYQHQSGLETLAALSPLFGNLGNQRSSSIGAPYSDILERPTNSSFQILFPSTVSLQRTFVQPIISAPEWNAMLAKCSLNPTDARPPVIMICGPKSSGKSTFAKLLINKLLLTPIDAFDNTMKPKRTGVALLDIDPGQPEYSVPGQVALLHLREPNFGPPFTHPVASCSNAVIRAHSIGAISPAMDTEHYMTCVIDLLSHYQQMAMAGCPLVINTPGWVLGTGLEILVDLITKSKPTTVIYMSQQGPPEVVSSLREAAKRTPVATIPSQVSEYTTRTAAHLRTMQYLSYFHLKQDNNHGLSWSGQPLTSFPPWEIRYSGENPGIVGVMCYGEQPPPEHLADTINGSMIAVVVIDDMAAILGWSQTQEAPEISSDATSQLRSEDVVSKDVGEECFSPWQTQAPLILKTPDEGIPYFNPANSTTIDPQHSHSIGLALVRGIDVARRRLQVLTPIEPRIIQEATDSGKHIVLVSGKLDTPGWAYTEALMSKSNAAGTDDNMIIEDEDDEDDAEDRIGIEGASIQGIATNPQDHGRKFENVPWVERLEGSQGRGAGSRVWRVRRDLGRQGDGD